ncbi:V-snare-domain-containing protein [Ascodesmis nigricans]|uniref:Golgi SNAP receptor complex member 1 n=1 Tax=Ascodesmis nigricans TaxID=341454 RepID=A0A4S2MTB9_9PEZI|nr:V-snare-domain-containing protein [Ascodesmis nigricans]
MTSTTNSWASLRQQARSLESHTENLFQTYSSFTSSPPPKPSSQELDTDAEIQDILKRRETTVASLARVLDSESALGSSAIKHQHLSLHRNTLAEHRKEYQRIKASITDSRNRTNLLTSVRNDINVYRSASRAEEGRANMSDGEYFLDERRRVDQSNLMADDVLNTAYAVNASFVDQRERLSHINRRMLHAAGKIPGINVIVGKIAQRKKRDSIIMASFIGFCFLMMLYFR